MFHTTIHLNNVSCLHADGARYRAARGKANSFCCPLGKTPGKGWVMVAGRDLAAIRQTANQQGGHTLTFKQQDEQGRETHRVTLKELVVVDCERLTGNGSRDNDAAWLLELSDARWLAQRYTDTGKLAVNWRASPAAGDYLSGTALGSTAAVLGQLWNGLEDLLGSMPSLPAGWSDPGPPENWIFDGGSAWDAMHAVLAAVGLTTRFDPRKTSSEGPVEFVANTADSLASPTEIENVSRYDTADLLINAPLPETIRVYFPIHLLDLGQEHDTGITSSVVTTARATSVDVATGISSAKSGSVLPLWDGLRATASGSGGTITNTSQLTAKATSIANQWLQARQSQTAVREWIGLVGGEFGNEPAGWDEARAIRWRCWCASPHSGGTATELLSGGSLVEAIVGKVDLRAACRRESRQHENSDDPQRSSHANGDAAGLRFSQPAYPRLMDVIEIQTTSSLAKAAGVYAGKLRRWSDGSLTTREDCWFKDAAAGYLQPGDLVWGRLGGRFSVSETEQPLYVGLVDPLIATREDCCYLATASAADSYDSATPISLDTEASSDARFSVDSGVITVAMNGHAKISYQVAAERTSGSGGTISKVTVQRLTSGGSWTDVPGSDVWFNQPAAGNGEQSASHVGVDVELANGDQLRLVIEQTAGSDSLTTIASGVQLMICPCGPASGVAVTPSTGLVARWQPSETLEEDEVWSSQDGLADFTVIGGTLTVHAVTGSPTPPSDSYYFFSSSQPYLEGPASSTLLDPTSFTIAAWVQDGGAGTGESTWLKFDTDDDSLAQFSVLGLVASALNVAYWNQTSDGGNSNATSGMVVSSWTHIALVGNGNQIRQYRNGELAGTLTLPDPPQSAGSAAVELGIRSGNGSLRLADLRIYDRVLSEAEIAALASEE